MKVTKHTGLRWLILLPVAVVLAGCQKRTVTLEALLDEMVSVEEPARYPDPFYTTHQESSYDRRSVSPDSAHWFANADGFGVMRVDTVEGRIEKVLFDQAGPGAITRIWITTLDKRGTWRFYFDGATVPGWTVPAYDMMRFGIPALGKGLLQAHTSYTPEGKGGNTLFLPIPYARHCRITFEDEPGVAPVPKYYHINYRKYPEGTDVETFSEAVVQRAANRIAAVDNLLLNPPAKTGGETLQAAETLHAGESLSLNLPQGENAVYELRFKANLQDSGYAQTMRQIIFQAEFDGKPTVWVPLSDFSGGGMGAPAVHSWFLNADGKGTVQSRWLMPYKTSGQLTLKNLNNHTVDVSMEAVSSPLAWDDRSLYFHASWRQERGIYIHNNPDEDASCSDWNFATLHGKGVYRGDLLSLFNHAPAWYGEGDEKIWVDGDVFPSHFGTGTEDYYNSSWAPVVPFHTPFGGAPRADLESSHGYNAFFRTRNLDAIPFAEKLRFDIEMIGWIRGTVDYATTVFWYGDDKAQATGCSGEEEAKQPLVPTPPNPKDYKIGNSLEFEEMEPSGKSASIRLEKQSTSGFANGKWSRACHLLGADGKPGDAISFRFDNLENRPYQIEMYATKAADYGIIAGAINGKKVMEFDGYADQVTHSGPIRLGTFTPDSQSVTLQVVIAGANKQSKGKKYLFGLDCIVLK